MARKKSEKTRGIDNEKGMSECIHVPVQVPLISLLILSAIFCGMEYVG